MNIHFLDEFFTSMLKQTYIKYDLIVVNDGYKEFKDIKRKYDSLNIIELEYSSSPAKNREHGINYIIEEQYDILIFGDSDDYFSDNRIEKSISLLDKYDIVVNDLSLFNDKEVYSEKYISNRIENNSIVEYDFIKDKNIFGLSNTALKIDILDKVEFDDQLVAVDWYFYKNLLKSNARAVFTNETETFYRQYANNTIGLCPSSNTFPLWWENRNLKGN